MTPTKLAWHQVQSFLLISPFHRAFGNLTAVIYLSSQTTGQVQTDNGGPDVDPGHVYYLTKGKHGQKRSQPETLDIEFTLNVASSDPNMTEPDVANQTVMVNHTTIPTSALFY